MDYNNDIPDIYDTPTKIHKNLDIISETYILKAYEQKNIKINKNSLLLYFKTEYNNLYINYTKIWNNRILFNSMGSLSGNIYLLENKSENNVSINIFQLIYSKLQRKIYLTECNNYFKNSISYNEISKHFSLISLYAGTISIRDKIFIKTYNEIKEKIIKFQCFNIIMFYKLILISKNIYYSYELRLCGIKNTFLDEYVDIDLNFNNLYEIYSKYLFMFNNIKTFMVNNSNYLNMNNIDIPEHIIDPDGVRNNIFYNMDITKIIQKYNIFYYDGYKISNH